ncbi:hypothetical protein ACFVWR_15400 [Leifsonia sp. NPDC058292]|uniref:hypothetical protein n=1 Tax=Leifsonia sp. NPDC058292 TaxID=3346428 RepID=UPI0036DC457F
MDAVQPWAIREDEDGSITGVDPDGFSADAKRICAGLMVDDGEYLGTKWWVELQQSTSTAYARAVADTAVAQLASQLLHSTSLGDLTHQLANLRNLIIIYRHARPESQNQLWEQTPTTEQESE